MTDQSSPAGHQTAPVDSLSGLFLMLYAKALGYLVLALCAFILLRRDPWSFSAADVVFWLCALTIPLARQRVARRFEGATVQEARTRAPRRMLIHLGAAAVLWVAGHSVRLLG